MHAVVNDWIKHADLFAHVRLSNQSNNREKFLDPLIELGWIHMEFPEKRTNPKQQY